MSNKEQIKARIERDKAQKAKKRYNRAHGIFRPNDGINLELLSRAVNDAARRCWWSGKLLSKHIQDVCAPRISYTAQRIFALDMIKSRKARLQAVTPYGEFRHVFTIQHLRESLQKRRKGVEWKGNVQRFIFHAVLNLKRMKDDLLAGNLNVNDTLRKIILHERGKRREIYAVMIDCRVVQGCLCDSCLIPLTEYRLIRDNPASVKGRGVSDARERLSMFLKEMAKKYRSDFHVMTSDFSSFFNSIRHIDCLSVLREAQCDRMIQGLGMKIARMHQESELAAIQDSTERLEKAESLRKCKGVGLTLGNQESQIMALVVPNSIDHAVKDGLSLRPFVRYMDDTFSADASKENLKRVGRTIKEKSTEKALRLNPKKTIITRAGKGFNFMQMRYFVTTTGHLVKNLVRAGIVRMRRKLKKFVRMVRRGEMSMDNVFQSFSAWFGNSYHADAYRTRKRMLSLYWKLFGGYRMEGVYA